MAKMAQSVNDEYKNLHALLATLPDPSVDTGPVAIILTLFLSYDDFIPSIYQLYFFGQVKDAEQRLRHKLFPPNAWMKTFHSTWSSSAPLRICA